VSAQFDWLGVQPSEYLFYNKTVALYYDDEDGKHCYFRYDEAGNVVIIPSVTSAVKIIDKSSALTQWASNMACDHIREAFDFYLNAEMGRFADLTTDKIEAWLATAKYAHRNFKEAAGDTGHIAHGWIEEFIKALIGHKWDRIVELLGNLPEDERARNGCLASIDWMARHGVVWIYTERKIYSKEHDFAGTMDGLAYVTACGDKNCCGEIINLVLTACTFKDILAVIDWKTSNGLYEEYSYQTAGYTLAFNEETGRGVEIRFLVRLGKELADFESRFLPPERLQDDVDTYLHALALHRSIDRRKAADKAVKDAVKALAKAEKEAAEAAEKARKAAIKFAIKTSKENAKADYKRFRAEKMPVVEAQRLADERLERALNGVYEWFGITKPEPDEEEIAA
jgi:hypothetical protein